MLDCLSSKVTINTDSLVKIVKDPRLILQDQEAFWDERPQHLTKLWAGNVGYEIRFDEWAERVRAWADLAPEARESHVLVKNARRLVDEKQAFLAKALPHLCSFFTPEADLNVTVQFTAFLPVNAFAQQDIVISIDAAYWNDNVDNILNVLVHEIGHAGFSYCRTLRTEPQLEDETLHKMLDNLQSEGICTYIGYTAQSIFPAPDEKDYALLDNPKDVERAFEQVNAVLAQVGNLTAKELQKLVWKECVTGRGYYVAGATMCKTIDERLGRQALVESLTTGPVFWIERYHSVAERGPRLSF